MIGAHTHSPHAFFRASDMRGGIISRDALIQGDSAPPPACHAAALPHTVVQRSQTGYCRRRLLAGSAQDKVYLPECTPVLEVSIQVLLKSDWQVLCTLWWRH